MTIEFLESTRAQDACEAQEKELVTLEKEVIALDKNFWSALEKAQHFTEQNTEQWSKELVNLTTEAGTFVDNIKQHFASSSSQVKSFQLNVSLYITTFF